MITYMGGYKYQLKEDYSVEVNIRPSEDILSAFIMLTTEGILTVKKGYAWDGASGPTIDTKNSMRGSLVHDALYQLMREGLLSIDFRYQADRELKIKCIEDGMWKWRANAWCWAVWNFAKKSATKKHKRKLQTAP